MPNICRRIHVSQQAHMCLRSSKESVEANTLRLLERENCSRIACFANFATVTHSAFCCLHNKRTWSIWWNCTAWKVTAHPVGKFLEHIFGILKHFKAFHNKTERKKSFIPSRRWLVSRNSSCTDRPPTTTDRASRPSHTLSRLASQMAYLSSRRIRSRRHWISIHKNMILHFCFLCLFCQF